MDSFLALTRPAGLGQEPAPVDGRSGASWLLSPTRRTADARRRIGLR